MYKEDELKILSERFNDQELKKLKITTLLNLIEFLIKDDIEDIHIEDLIILQIERLNIFLNSNTINKRKYKKTNLKIISYTKKIYKRIPNNYYLRFSSIFAFPLGFFLGSLSPLLPFFKNTNFSIWGVIFSVIVAMVFTLISYLINSERQNNAIDEGRVY